MDAKEIGLGVKNLVVGIASAVAGGYGGAPAASGVLMAGSAIDTLVEAGTGKKEGSPDIPMGHPSRGSGGQRPPSLRRARAIKGAAEWKP